MKNIPGKQDERSYGLAKIISRTILQKVDWKLLSALIFACLYEMITLNDQLYRFFSLANPNIYIYICLAKQETEKLHQIQALHSLRHIWCKWITRPGHKNVTNILGYKLPILKCCNQRYTKIRSTASLWIP